MESKSAEKIRFVPLILVQIASGMRDIPQLAFFLIFLQEQLRLPTVTISSVVAGGQLVGMIMALLGGAIVAQLGSKKVLAAGLALAGLGSLVFQVRSLGWVVSLWLLGGTGLALVTVSGASYLTRISAGGALGMLAAFYALSATVGGAIGNPLAGLLIERSGFTAFSWAALAVSFIAILIVVFGMQNIQDPAPPSISFGSLWSGIQHTARQRNIRMLIGLRCLPTIFYGLLTVLIPLLLNTVSGSKLLVAAYGTANLVVASAAQLLVGRAADRWKARRPTLVAYTAMILSGIGLTVTSGTVVGLFSFGVLGIASAWSLSTLMYVWVNDGVPKADHPSTFGLLHAVWSLSMICGSVLSGWSAAPLPGLPFLVTGLLNVGSLFLIRAYYTRQASSSEGSV